MKLKINYFSYLLLSLFVLACNNENSHLDKGIYASIETDKGNILLKLHQKETPLTVANFVSLAEGTNDKVVDSLKGKEFYNNLPFHRVIPDFMIQGGDIKRNGSGNPGYKFADEFPKDKEGNLLFSHDKKGILSMANSGPNSNGSQFFITHKETPWLNGKHTIFGEVVEGLNIVDSIAQGDLMHRIEIIRVGSDAKNYDPNAVFSKALKDREAQEIENKKNQLKDSIAFSEKMMEAKARVLPSGLKILSLEKGNGKKVELGSRVQVHYTGYFAHGEIFDTSSKRNQTFDLTVGVDRVIEGWTEGLQEMQEGEKARLFVPYDLGYGADGYGPIPAKASLIFDVEVVKIVQ
ncbi:peptidylprolyl isomerase [Flavicella sediminum]|uniref:peptidylprolyl isomerase n=1 Tax=Flavicella sediminum TaxID=2585141 RepID=UPI0011213373|nr:peptidylprolyl isomerase [Flavicella sediminum]